MPPAAAPSAPVLTIVPPPHAASAPSSERSNTPVVPERHSLTPVLLDFGDLPELGTGAYQAPTVNVEAVHSDDSEGGDTNAGDTSAGDTNAIAPPLFGDAIDAVGFPPLDHSPVIGAPTLKLVADNARPVSPIAPPEPPVLFVAPAVDVVTDADEVEIGDVTLSSTLWRILADEAGQHLATLEHELSLLQFDPQHVPSNAMIRASHTLCGIHRTGGFRVIAAQAKALELTLIALQQRGAPMPAVAQPVLGARGSRPAFARGLRAATQVLSCSRTKSRRESIAAELDELRHEAMTGEAIDAETAAAEQAARDEEMAKAAVAEAPSRGLADFADRTGIDRVAGSRRADANPSLRRRLRSKTRSPAFTT